jgi:hypothetical protein
MRKKGASQRDIIGAKEMFQMMEAGVQINNWSDWTNHYKAVILSPPIDFYEGDPCANNYGDPISALRSYLRAVYTGDAYTLLKCADDSGKNRLKRTMQVDESIKKVTYKISTNILNQISVLLTARTEADGKDYVLVFWRAQNENNPTNGLIALQNTFFVHEGDSYLLTDNVGDTMLARLLSVNHAEDAALCKYADFMKVMGKTSFPTNFYTIR